MTDLHLGPTGQNRSKTASEARPPYLNAKAKPCGEIRALDRSRARVDLSHAELCRRAGIKDKTWADLRAGRRTARAGTIRNLKSTIIHAGGPIRHRRVVAPIYSTILALVCAECGYDLAAVRGQAHYPARTSDAGWVRAADARGLAIYLTNCGIGVRQSEIAKMLEMTPAAISIAVARVEDERDDTGFDALLTRLEHIILGDEA